MGTEKRISNVEFRRGDENEFCNVSRYDLMKFKGMQELKANTFE